VVSAMGYDLKKTRDGFLLVDDEEEILRIPDEVYFSMNLYEKDTIDEKEFLEIKNHIQYKEGKKIGHRANIYHNKSAVQIYAKLQEKGISHEVSSKIIQEMIEEGRIDEKEVIRRFVKERMKLKPTSKKILKLELRKRGFQDVDVENICKEVYLCDDHSLERVLRKKSVRKFSREKKIRHLLSKGFDYDSIQKALALFEEDE
jgi:regulatory protein